MPNSNKRSPASATATDRNRPAANAFRLVAGGFLGMMAGAGAPSPVYRVYQRTWHFSPSIVALVFGAYVAALLVALLGVGNLSDRMGRRRVLVGALLVLAASMLLFAGARGLPDVLAARIVQGLATGTATGAFGAAVIDLQPRAQLGSYVTAVAPTLGPGTGALLSALLIDFAPWPRRTVFVLLAALYLTAAVLIRRADAPALDSRADGPGPAPLGSRGLRVGGAWTPPDARAARPRRAGPPRFALPPEFRGLFWRYAPTLVAAWSVGGLFLALAPSFMPVVFGVGSGTVGALTIFLLLGAGSVAASLLRPHPATARGNRIACGGLIVGTVVLVAGVGSGSTAVFLAGCLMTGVAFGAALFLATAVLSAAIPAAQRSGVLSVIFVVNYLAFAVPPLAAGICATRYGFAPTLLVYLCAAAALSMAAILALTKERGRA